MNQDTERRIKEEADKRFQFKPWVNKKTGEEIVTPVGNSPYGSRKHEDKKQLWISGARRGYEIAMDRWIDVKKEMPPNGKWVLLYTGYWTGVGKHDPHDGEDEEEDYEPEWQDETSEYIGTEPTHWQPLPSPPKQKP